MLTSKLKAERENAGMSLSELSKVTGISKSTLQRYETGTTKKVPIEAISTIENALNLTQGFLMGWNEKNSFSGTSSTDDSVPKGMERYNPVMYKIPILGQIAAGLPIFADENIEDYTYTEHNGGAEYFALRVKGDSMNALSIKNGSIIIVRQQPQVENGEVAVVRVNDDSATVKCFKQEGRMVYLIPRSYDPKYEVQIYDLKRDRIEIIGKVVECKIEF